MAAAFRSHDTEQSDTATAGRPTAVGALFGALEEPSRREDGEDRRLFSWPGRQTALPASAHVRAEEQAQHVRHGGGAESDRELAQAPSQR